MPKLVSIVAGWKDQQAGTTSKTRCTRSLLKATTTFTCCMFARASYQPLEREMRRTHDNRRLSPVQNTVSPALIATGKGSANGTIYVHKSWQTYIRINEQGVGSVLLANASIQKFNSITPEPFVCLCRLDHDKLMQGYSGRVEAVKALQVGELPNYPDYTLCCQASSQPGLTLPLLSSL